MEIPLPTLVESSKFPGNCFHENSWKPPGKKPDFQGPVTEILHSN